MYSSESGNILTREVTQIFVVQRLRIKTNKHVNTVWVQAAPYCPHKDCWLKKASDSWWLTAYGFPGDRPVAIVLVWTSRRPSDKTDTSVHNSGQLKNTPQLCRTSLTSRVADTARLLSGADLLITKSVSPVTDRSGSHAYVTCCHRHTGRDHDGTW